MKKNLSIIVPATLIIAIIGIHAIGIDLRSFTANEVKENLAIIEASILYFLKIIIWSLLIIAVFRLLHWVRKDEGVFIQPFTICNSDLNFSGAAISDLLVAELNRICSIQEHANLEFSKQRRFLKIKTAIDAVLAYIRIYRRLPLSIPKTTHRGSNNTENPVTIAYTKMVLPSIIHSSENLAFNASSIEIQGGPVTVSANQVLTVLRKIIGRPSDSILGCIIQKDVSSIRIVAWRGTTKVEEWEVYRSNTNEQERNGNSCENIQEMMKELAFKTALEISKEKPAAKTWIGLKLFTDALEQYVQYNSFGDENLLKRSLDLCLEATKAEEGYKEPANLMHNIGVKYLDKDKHSEAENAFRETIRLNPEPNSFLGLGASLDGQHKFSEAIECYEKAIKLDSDFADGWNNKGVSQYNLNEFEKAKNCFDECIRIEPLNAGAWNNRGAALIKQDKYDEAIKACNNAITIYPGQVDAWTNKGAVFARKSEYEKAINCFDEAIKLNQNFSMAWNNKGYVLNAVKEFQGALESLDEAIRLNPKLDLAWKNSGEALAGLGYLDKAIERYDEAIRINKDYAKAWYCKGNALAALKKYDEAIQAYDKAIEIDPNMQKPEIIKA